MKRNILALTCCFLAFAGIAAQAQIIGVAAIGGHLNEPEFNNAGGVGLWLTVPVGQSKWHAGAAGNLLQSRHKYKGRRGFLGSGNWQDARYTNRFYSASILVTREIATVDNFGFSIGPSVGYASVGAKGATVFADRIFAGAWVNGNYILSENFKVELIVHPRVSPKGNGGSDDAYDPYSGTDLTMFEMWIGISYTLGKSD